MKTRVRLGLVAIAASLMGLMSIAAITAQQQTVDPPKPSFTGKVVSIADGDTITVLLDNHQHRIRLEGIDCPETGQDFGTAAKKAIADKVFGKEVTVKWTQRDKYKRILGDVYLGERSMSLELVQEGMAWHYVQYSKDPALAKAEKEAKAAKVGLWSMPNPIAPWDFRHGKGEADPVAQNKDNTELAKTTVYVTRTGMKYHRAGCRYLAKSMIQTTLGEASGKFGPCSVCNPPVLEVAAVQKNKKEPPKDVNIGEPKVVKSDGKKEIKVAFLGDKKPNFEKWEKDHAIKIKSIGVYETVVGKGQPYNLLKFLCVYAEDDKPDPTTMKKKVNIQEQFSGIIYFFDEDGVVLGKVGNNITMYTIEGELTGIKGDAFRYCVMIPANVIQAKRIELREK